MSGGGRRAWEGSSRRSRLPANWSGPDGLRDQVLNDPRDPRSRVCRLGFDGCTGYATEVDHIVAGDDHGLSNLQPVCSHCHKIKSAREGAAARPRLYRDAPVHPALR